MNLYFQNSQGKLRLIAEPTSDKEVHVAIKQFLDKHNFKSYYTRIWFESKGTKTSLQPLYVRENNAFVYDVGSHTEFFELEITDDDMDNLENELSEAMIKMMKTNL